MAFGTLSVTDLLANQQTIAQFGEDSVWASIQALLDAHNAIMGEMLGDLAEFSTDRLRRFGGAADFILEDVTEFGAPDVQKAVPGQNVGFPLKSLQGAIGWNRKYMLNASVGELAKQFVGLTDGDRRRVIYEVKLAIFNPANRTVTDRLVQPVLNLPVKALVNADGAALPPNPIDGSTFNAATHTHYLGTAAFADADLAALVKTVTEHYGAGAPRVYINQAQEAAVRAFASFIPFFDTRVSVATTTTYAIGGLDVVNLYNRRIGLHTGAEVWVKPWIPPSYVFAYVAGAPVPLVARQRAPGSAAFQIVADDENYPLRARTMEREIGLGIWNRTNGAVLYTGGASYTMPTLTP